MMWGAFYVYHLYSMQIINLPPVSRHLTSFQNYPDACYNQILYGETAFLHNHGARWQAISFLWLFMPLFC